jgi:hypothetical protein
MADFTGGSVTSGAGVAGSVQLAANFRKHAINQADVGREFIVKLAGTNLTDANLSAVIGYITTSHGTNGAGDSAFTVAAVGTADGTAFESGVTDNVFLRVQGTGDLTVGTADQGIGGLTVTIEAIFTPAK